MIFSPAILIFIGSCAVASSMSVNQVIQKEQGGGKKHNGATDTTPDDSYLDTTIPYIDTTTQKKPSCGVTSPLAPKIVGGKNVTSTLKFPWLGQLQLLRNDGWHGICGATLISEYWLISAAYCLFPPGNYTAKVVGVIFSSLPDNWTPQYRPVEGEVKIKITQTILHEGYNHTAGTYENNICLYKLETPAPYSDTVRPACLPCTSYNYTGMDFTVAGWGLTSEEGKLSGRLMEVSVPYVPNDICAEEYDDIFNTSICAGGISGKDSCSGDSGGGLMSNHGGVNYVAGVVSWGDGCGEYYAVYTNVNSYIGWIEDKTGDTFC